MPKSSKQQSDSINFDNTTPYYSTQKNTGTTLETVLNTSSGPGYIRFVTQSGQSGGTNTLKITLDGVVHINTETLIGTEARAVTYPFNDLKFNTTAIVEHQNSGGASRLLTTVAYNLID